MIFSRRHIILQKENVDDCESYTKEQQCEDNHKEHKIWSQWHYDNRAIRDTGSKSCSSTNVVGKHLAASQRNTLICLGPRHFQLELKTLFLRLIYN